MTHRSSVPLLVLAHLGVAPLACNQVQDPPVNIPPPSGPIIVPASATATSLPSATASATPSASASAAPTEAPLGDGECMTDSDCRPYQRCNASPRPNTAGHCAQIPHYRLGRPLVVGDEPRVAAYVDAPSDGDELLRAAQDEHASVAAFARTIVELMALGAPSWLLAETQGALADEIRHTETTLDLVLAATGRRPVLGRLEAAIAPLRTDAAELLRDVFRGGCVGETLAAAHAESQRDAATSPAHRAHYDTIVRDEAKHAALAFKTARWLVEQMPELTSVIGEEKGRFSESASFEERTLLGPLLEMLPMSS